MNEILLVEQDCCERAEIVALLDQNGFDVILADNREQVLHLVRTSPFDLVILGLHLDAGANVLLCKSIHEIVDTPVMLIINVQGDDGEIMAGLEAGASDFITRPIRSSELTARIRTLLRRSSSPLALPGWMLQHEDLLLDLRSRRAMRRGQPLPLTRTELRLLRYFMIHAEETISKTDLLKAVWNYHDVLSDNNLVESAIKRLRSSIEDDPKNPRYIHTVWGEGYRFGK